MYLIEKEYSFCASHILPLHLGKCSRLHGHNYKIVISCCSEDTQIDGPATGMVFDFYELDKIMKPLIEKVDHSHLNDSMKSNGDEIYTTAENISKWFFDAVSSAIPLDSVFVKSVTVYETEKCKARYEV